MTREIPLTRGLVALVDDEDYERLAVHKWHANPGRWHYARREVWGPVHGRADRWVEFMHRVVIGAPKGVLVDHVNGNILDNRKANLRLCSGQQNAANRASKPRNGVPRGVIFEEISGRWRAYIYVGGKKFNLGRYRTVKEAAAARAEIELEWYGEFSPLVGRVNVAA